MRSIFYFLSLLVSVACAIPVEGKLIKVTFLECNKSFFFLADGGRLSRYRYKTTSFSDVDGNTLEDSYSNEGGENIFRTLREK